MTTLVPFKILDIGGDGFHLMLKLYINKKVAHVIIDTGASKSVFDKTRIEKYVAAKTFEKHDSLSSGLGTNTMTRNLPSKTISHLDFENFNFKIFFS